MQSLLLFLPKKKKKILGTLQTAEQSTRDERPVQKSKTSIFITLAVF